MFDDRFVELHTFPRIRQRSFEGGAGDTQRLRGDADAAAFQVGEGDRQALAALTQQVGSRDAAVVQGDRAGVRCADAHLVFAAIHHETGVFGRHQKG